MEVKVRPTKKLITFLRKWHKEKNLPDDMKDVLNEFQQDARLTVEQLKWCKEALREEDEECYLHQFIRTSEVFLPQPVQPPRNPELEARIQRLKAEQSNREYEQMVHGISPQSNSLLAAPVGDIGKEIKMINRQLIQVLQFVLTVAGSFVFGFKGLQYTTTDPDTATCLLTGLVTAFVVAIADLYFIAKYVV